MVKDELRRKGSCGERMANGHDNALRLSPQAMPEAHACAGADGVDAFVRAEQRDLLNFLRRRTANEEDAQDAVQESLTRWLRYSDTEPREVWKPLLYRIATNIALDLGRGATRRHTAQHVSLDDYEIPSQAPSQEEAASRAQDLTRIRAAILELPPKCRQVYLLSLEGWKQSQIAAHCGISVKMVEKHVTKALAAIRRRAGDSSGGALR